MSDKTGSGRPALTLRPAPARLEVRRGGGREGPGVLRGRGGCPGQHRSKSYRKGRSPLGEGRIWGTDGERLGTPVPPQRHRLRDRSRQPLAQPVGLGGAGGSPGRVRGAGPRHPVNAGAVPALCPAPSPPEPPGLKLPGFVTVRRQKTKRFHLAGTSCTPAPCPWQRGGGGGDLPPHLPPRSPQGSPRSAAAPLPLRARLGCRARRR